MKKNKKPYIPYFREKFFSGIFILAKKLVLRKKGIFKMALDYTQYESLYIYGNTLLDNKHMGNYKVNKENPEDAWRYRVGDWLEMGPVENLLEAINNFSDECDHIEICWDVEDESCSVYLIGWTPATAFEIESVKAFINDKNAGLAGQKYTTAKAYADNLHKNGFLSESLYEELCLQIELEKKIALIHQGIEVT